MFTRGFFRDLRNLILKLIKIIFKLKNFLQFFNLFEKKIKKFFNLK